MSNVNLQLMQLLNHPLLDKPAFTVFVAVISSIIIVCHSEGTLMFPELFFSSCNLLYPMKLQDNFLTSFEVN